MSKKLKFIIAGSIITVLTILGISQFHSNNSEIILGAGQDSYTKLLLHGDGADGSTTITDETGKTVTAAGTAQIDTAQKVFGTASILFDGNSDYATSPHSADWAFGNGDFTIDLRMRFNGSSANAELIGQWETTGNQRSWLVEFYGGNLSLNCSTNGTNNTVFSSAWTPSANTWYHVAMVRNGNNLYFFVDGTQLGTTKDISAITFYDSSGQIMIASYATGASLFLNGWMDEIRISKGIARWTANFTPPTEAYSADAVAVYQQNDLINFQ